MNTKRNNKTFESLNLLDLVTVQAIKPRLYNFQLKNNSKKQKQKRQKTNSRPSQKITFSTQQKWQPLFMLKNRKLTIQLSGQKHEPKKLLQHFQTISDPSKKNCFRGFMYKKSIHERKGTQSTQNVYDVDFLKIKRSAQIRSVQQKRPPHQNFSTVSLEDTDKSIEKYNSKNRIQRRSKCRTADFYLGHRNKSKSATKCLQFQSSKKGGETESNIQRIPF